MTEAPPERPARGLRRLLREPILIFLAIGALLFLADRLLHPPAPAGEGETEPIVITEGFRRGLIAQHRRRTGRAPSEEELAGLERSFLEEEALCREARRAGLEVGDVIVRRRLAQKMRFLIESRVEVPEPSEEELRALLEALQGGAGEGLRRPARLSLRHVFFSREARGEGAEAEARAALAALTAPPDPPEADRPRPEALGDPFLAGHRFAGASAPRLDARFGPGFAAELEALPLSRWSGPVPSAYGQHLIFLEAREEARPLTLEEARPELLARWRRQRREEAVAEEIRRLVAAHRSTDRQGGRGAEG